MVHALLPHQVVLTIRSLLTANALVFLITVKQSIFITSALGVRQIIRSLQVCANIVWGLMPISRVLRVVMECS